MESKLTLKDLILYAGALFGAVALYLNVRKEEAWAAVGMFALWFASVACIAWVIHQERKLRKEAEADASRSYNAMGDSKARLEVEVKQSLYWHTTYQAADKKVEDLMKDMNILQGKLNDANREIARLKGE